MKKHDLIIHILGTILVLSTLHYSSTPYSLIAVLPFALVSYSIERDEERLLLPSLILATLVPSFFLTTGSMNELFSLIVFSIVFGIPLFLYWTFTLLEKTEIGLKAAGAALTYVLITCLIFYLLPELLGISEFIFSPENTGPQTLMFLGSGMIVALPFHVILELKS